MITRPLAWRAARPALPVLLALVFLALHLPYLPASLDDVDSINFALGMRRFDVAQHQPHPPGYPVFIVAAKAADAVTGSAARALGALSVLSGTLGVLALAWLFQQLAGADRRTLWPVSATAIAMTSPLYWVTSARPLSDMMGLAAAVGVQAMTLAARTDRGLVAAAFCAGVAAGIRSQVLWLTVPLVAYRCLVPDPFRSDRGESGTMMAAVRQLTRRGSAAVAAFVAGVAVWLVPLVALTGGPGAYRRVLFDQGLEDLSGVRMLWTTPTPRALLDDLYYAFVAPWAVWPMATAVLIFALIGLIVLLRRHSRSLALAAIAFGPYIALDLIFQEFVTVRYALPIVLPVAWLAAAGLRALPAPAAILATGAIVMFDAHVGGRSIAALSRQPAPAFRALDDMRRAAEVSPRPVFAPDRRQSLDLRRPLLWLGAGAPSIERQLPAPPQHEWLEAVRYWDGGGRAPVWFVTDPRRAAIDLVQHTDPVAYRWSVPYPVLLSGTRPADLDWYAVDRPEWYVGEGWSLTPESAGVAEADRRGLAFGPIEGRIHRDAARGAILLGGRNFDPAIRARLTALVGGRLAADFVVPPGPFLLVRDLPADPFLGTGDYLPVVLTADPPARIGLEQFDASSSRGLLGFGAGWHERELNPATGQQWRWLSDRAELQYVMPASGGVLRIEGESPQKYYAAASRLIVRAGETVLRDTTVSTDFTIEVPVPAARQPSTLIVQTDQIHVPAERGWRPSPDRRRLGLRIFKCQLRPAS